MLVISIAVISCSNNPIYDPTKAHHGTDSFISANQESFFSWIKMRINEGDFPIVNQADVESILTETDKKLIHSPSDMPRATWIGHATMLVQYRGINYLTDPHLSDVAAPVDFLSSKRLTKPALTFDEMPKIDFIVISHNHYDHLDLHTVKFFGNKVMWYVPLGLKTWFVEQGISSERVIELDWWESHQFNEDVSITFTPSIHWSKRSLWDNNESLWGSWSIKIADFNTWFAGDTGYDKNIFKEIGQRTGPYHLSFIPIGAYAPIYFMKGQHVSPEQALQIHLDINTNKSIPIHWGTFQLTKEPFLEPPKLLAEALVRNKLPENIFGTVKIGETTVIHPH